MPPEVLAMCTRSRPPKVPVHSEACATLSTTFGTPSCSAPDRCYTFPRTEPAGGVEMLDAYIINRIRREREPREPARPQPRIEMPMQERWPRADPRSEDSRRESDTERGVAIIDFTI